jgi:hypothetical protein
VIFDIAGFGIITIYAPKYNGPPLQYGVSLTTVTLLAIILLPIFVTVISGAFALPRIARSSRDLTLRRQLKWFGLFVVFLLIMGFSLIVASAVGVAIPQTNALVFVVVIQGISFTALGVAGYCLYRSARALIPGAEKLPILAATKGP